MLYKKCDATTPAIFLLYPLPFTLRYQVCQRIGFCRELIFTEICCEFCFII